jgi:ribosomal protein S18 acetylase RimI-like enzyme
MKMTASQAEQIAELINARNKLTIKYDRARVREAEYAARAKDARLLQCTIRVDNTASRQLFEKFGFSLVGTFHNEKSKNKVNVFQKVLANAR